jgi:hypothetical protein
MTEMQCTVVGWLPATIRAFVSIGSYHADKRTDRAISAGNQQATADPHRI